MGELGKPYTFKCTAANPPGSSRACMKPAITPIEKDGSMYCEDHMEQSKASEYLRGAS